MNTKKTTVAVIDDHLLYREALVRLLNTSSHYEVLVDASHTESLLEKVKTGFQPELILLGLNSPLLKETDNMEWINVRLRKTKVIGLSGYVDNFTTRELQQLGIHYCLPKTASPQDIFSMLATTRTPTTRGICRLPPGKTSSYAARIVAVLDELKKNELRFLKLACTDLSYQQIAKEMNVSRFTIDDYRNTLFKKLNVTTRAGLILIAIKHKLVTLDQLAVNSKG